MTCRMEALALSATPGFMDLSRHREWSPECSPTTAPAPNRTTQGKGAQRPSCFGHVAGGGSLASFPDTNRLSFESPVQEPTATRRCPVRDGNGSPGRRTRCPVARASRILGRATRDAPRVGSGSVPRTSGVTRLGWKGDEKPLHWPSGSWQGSRPGRGSGHAPDHGGGRYGQIPLPNW